MKSEPSLSSLVRSRVFRHAHCYAPDPVMAVVRDIATATELTLVLDVDALERSALARIDRVMLLAFDALAHSGVRIVFAASHEHDRAVRLPHRIKRSTYVDLRTTALDALEGPLLVITDDPTVLAMLDRDDRGIALGRPELASARVAAAGHASVRATLWWLLDERSRASAS